MSSVVHLEHLNPSKLPFTKGRLLNRVASDLLLCKEPALSLSNGGIKGDFLYNDITITHLQETQ